MNVKLLKTIFLAGLFSLLWTGRTYAYLDPGTGSYVLQMIIAGLLGAGFTIKIFWKNIRLFFDRLFTGRQKSGCDEGS